MFETFPQYTRRQFSSLSSKNKAAVGGHHYGSFKVEFLTTRLTAACRRRALSGVAVCAIAAAACQGAALADTSINSGSTVLASSLGTGTPDFKGGTLQLDAATTIANNFTLEDNTTNTIDADGHVVTMSGTFTNTSSTAAGSLIFTDSVGGGNVILTNSGNAYTGETTINSGATLSLSGAGSLATSSGIADGGTFDISQTTSGASIISLGGAGGVNLGAQTLTLTDAVGTYTGTISGTGGLTLAAGTEILGGANSYTGGTTITAGTLQIGDGVTSGSITGNVADGGTLEFNRVDAVTFGGTISGHGGITQAGSGTLTLTAANTYTGPTTIAAGILVLSSTANIANSSGVTDNGIFDISQTGGASIKSLSGSGTVQLGAGTLTITAASGAFSGVISGTGGLVLAGGTQLLSGTSAYSGPTTITAGTLEVGASTIAYNVADSGTFAFDSTAPIVMSGVVSGPGGLSQIGTGVSTLTAVQTYTGPTVITAGTLALSGSGSIASSSGVADAGILDISGTAGGATITSISGAGSVTLGAQNLTLTSASGTYSGNISGTGGVILAGGKETFTGSNAYTGPTVIASGILVLSGTTSLAASSRVIDNATLDVSTVTNGGVAPSTAIVSLAGSGTVFLGTKTLVFTNAGDTFSGTISGTGGLTVSGGTQTLSGANTYTGPTTISAGTLALAGGGSLSTMTTVADNGIFDISAASSGAVALASLSGSGTVNLGAQTLNLVNASTTFSGSIIGTGGVVVSGGTEVLSGANSYSGGTVISAGTLQVGNFSTGSITGNVLDNGILAFDRSNAMTFAGAITGTGAVTQIGEGTTILTGASNYSGGTTITAGTLQIGNGAASGSISGDVTDNGMLAFGRSDTTVFAGTISGSGGVTQLSGTTILTAVNSYTGATAIGSGAELVLSGPGSIAASSGVTDNGLLDVSAAAAPRVASLAGGGAVNLGAESLTITNAAGAFSGAVSGGGGVTVNAGTQTFSGTNSYTGPTTINGGSLLVNGSIASSSGVTVNSGGTLGGMGTVSGVTVGKGATLAPGAAGAGTLTVNGVVAFDAASNFVVNLSSASAAKLVTTGAESLAGTLSFASTDGTYPLGQKLTVLTAEGGITGTFTLAPPQGTGANLSSSLSYDADDVYLQVNLAQLSPLLPTGATANQASPIGGIDAAIKAGDALPSQFQALGSISPAALAGDAQQMAGQIGSDVSQAGKTLLSPFLDAIFDHIDDSEPNGSGPRRRGPQQPQIWVSGFASSTIIQGDPATAGTNRLSANSAGFAGGADWLIAPDFTLGGAVSAGTANFHLAGGLGQGNADAFQAAAYGLIWFRPVFYGAFAGVLALDDITTKRVLTVSGTDDLQGKLNTITFGGRYEAGLKLGWIAPYLALEDELFSAPGYTETAASGSDGFALKYSAHTANTADLELGARQSGDIALSRNWVLNLSDRLAWAHALSAAGNAHAAFAALPDSEFAIYGAQPARDSALVSLGAGLKSRYGLDLSLHFDGDIARNSQTYTGILGLGVAW